MDIKTLIKEINTNYEVARSALTALEKKQNDLYHVLEYVNLDAVKMMKVAKELRAVLRARREAKETFYKWQSYRDNLISPLGKCLNQAEKQQKRDEQYKQESIKSAKQLGVCHERRIDRSERTV